jgi:uncharacterized membrane protein YdjX (TVP38/TMEM64 family)
MTYIPKPVLPPRAVLVTVLVVVAAVALGLWAYGVNHDAVVTLLQRNAARLRELPWPVFYLAIALLPVVFFPVSVLFLSAGAVHGVWPSLAGIVVALALNISLGYWLAAGPLRGLIQKWFAKRGRIVPVLPANEHIWAVLAVRFAPGLPLMAQNYLLGLARVPFWKYFWISLIVETGIAFGFILAGELITEKHPGYVLLAFACILGVVVAARLLRRVFAPKVHPLATKTVAAKPGVSGAGDKNGEPAGGSPEKR